MGPRGARQCNSATPEDDVDGHDCRSRGKDGEECGVLELHIGLVGEVRVDEYAPCFYMRVCVWSR